MLSNGSIRLMQSEKAEEKEVTLVPDVMGKVPHTYKLYKRLGGVLNGRGP